MARITPHSGSPQDTHDYYLPKQAEYYSGGPAFEFEWLGQGAKRLGLAGSVQSEQFMRLLHNQHPLTGKKLSPRTKVDRRTGWDVNFNAPKSVSIAFGLNKDTDIVDALRQSVNETLAEMEQDVMVRVRKRGQNHEEKTGNFVAGVVIHPEARGVEGQAPDPNLHAHAFISNHTLADRWYAADVSNLFRDAQGYYEAAFQSRLARKLEDLGYAIERSEHNFEIAGISRELIEKFSKRSAQIDQKISEGVAEKLAAKHGVSLAEAKDMLGAMTRDAKDASYTLSQLRQHWQSQLTPANRRALTLVEQQKVTPSRRSPPRITASQAVSHALEHGFEQHAALRERQVLADAILYGIEGNTVDQLKTELAGRDLIRQGRDEAALLTTKALQREELGIINFAKHGRGQCKSIDSNHQITREHMTKEQAAAAKALLASTDRVQLLRGVAGSGKTSTVMREVIDAMQSHRNVAVLAPTNKAAHEVLKEDGFEAVTVASFLKDESSQQQFKHGVIWVDEAGLVDNSTMAALFQTAQRLDARVILSGDERQHAPVGRGHPWKLIERAGIEPKQVTRIFRQKAAFYKEAVTHLSRGEVAEGFERLKELGFVHEIMDETRNARLAKDYADAARHYKPKDLLVIAATHAERRNITAAIRHEFKSRGILKGDDRSLTTLVPKQLSAAERRDALHFEPGDVIVYHAKAAGGIQAGDQFTVSDSAGNQVIAGNRRINLDSAASFNVFRPQTSGYAVGDMIRLTRGRREQGDQKRLNNGGLHVIKSFHKGVITLDNDVKLPADWRFFDHGFAVTSHVSQGATVKRAFVAASSLSFPASSPEQIYVSASRAKKRVDLYTDSVEGLERAISRLRPKLLATDVTPDPKAHHPRQRFGQRLNHVREIARRYATRQPERFGSWFDGRKSLEPQLAR